MSIFNKLLDPEESEGLPGENPEPEKKHDFFFCFNIK